VLTNLIFNAVTHGFTNGPGGHMVIKAHRIGMDQVEITFSDDGSGIPEEVQRHVFDPFFTTRRAQGSTGLGLYIAYTIPVFLRWRMGDAFQPGSWTLGAKYKWINLIAIFWVGLCVIIFCLPTTPAGVFGGTTFSWNSANYAPILTIGVMAIVTIWYLVSAKNTFKGPVRTIDDDSIGLAPVAASPRPTMDS